MDSIFERLDVLLLKKNIFVSRERAKENIIKGNVFVNGIKITKCGKKVLIDSDIVFVGEPIKYVSRGGLKLEKAIHYFDIDLMNKVCVDIGASTGGFTDCMLQHGAREVFALDVGSNQLADKLKCDNRVISYENTNVKQLNADFFGQKVDFVTADVSFISLTKVLPYIAMILEDEATIVALIKPQFEAGKKNLNKQGVVKNKKIHIQIVTDILKVCSDLQLTVIDFDYSPIKGPNGNIEYLMYCSKKTAIEICKLDKIISIINKSFEEL